MAKEQFEQAWDETTLADIKENPVMQQVLKDSFGGIMYNVANYGKYDATTLLNMWDSLSPSYQESAGGLIKGAINFLKGN